jgi:hypothetical protein
MRVAPAFPVLALAAFLAASSPAFAQDDDDDRRPNRALFESGFEGGDQQLEANGSAGIGYDTNTRIGQAEAGLVGPRGPATESGYSILSGGLTYSRQERRFGMNANGSVSRRFYYALEQDALSVYDAGIAASFSRSSRTTFNLGQTIGYQPFSLFSLFPQAEPPQPGEPSGPPIDYYTSDQNYLSSLTTGGFSHQLSRRSTFTADYSRHFSRMPASEGHFVTQTGSARFTRSFTQGLGLRLGYGYTRATYDQVGDGYGHHLIDSGIDYSRNLSGSRRTTLSFSTGGSVVTDRNDTRFMVTGNVNLLHEIGRTWNFNAAYNRSVDFVEVYSAPVEYQSVNLQLTGLLSRRLSVHTGVGATNGSFLTMGQGASSSGFGNIYSSTGLGTALNRHLNLAVNYSFYWYQYDDALLLQGLQEFSGSKGRHSLSASIEAWAPLFQRGRRRDAPR